MKGSHNSNYQHGMTRTRIYVAWRAMKSRCNNPNSVGYKNYGGRGITYTKDWSTFEGFFKDMSSDYRDDLTLDRINVNGNYCKSNCRWITKSMQSRNKRANIKIMFEGKECFLFELAERFKINYHTLYSRLYLYGVSIEDAVKHKNLLHGRHKAKQFLAEILK